MYPAYPVKMAVFAVVVPCTAQKFTDFSEILAASIITVQQPRRQPSLYSPP
jgi:hypothetical protein